MLAEHVLKRAGALIDARAKQIDFDQEGQKRSADAIARAEAKGPAGKLEVDRLRAAEVRRAAGVRQRLDEYERELERLQSMAHYTFDELAKNVELHPLDVRVVIGRAKLAQALAAWLGDDSLLEVMEPELAQTIPKSPRRQELAYLLAAIQQELALRGMRELERALQASPHVEALRRQQALIQLRHVPSLRAAAEALPAGDGLRADLERAIAAIELEQRRYDEAEALLRRTIEDDEEIDEGWWRLAMLLNARRKLAEARAVVAEAEGKVGRVSAQGQQVFDAIRATAPAAPEAPAAPAAPVAPGAPGS